MTFTSPDQGESEWFVVIEDIRDRDLAARACQAVIDILKPRATRASVDAYTDYRKAMPPDIREVQAALHAKGKLEYKRDPGMNVQLDLSSVEDWDLLTHYAPWSINVDLYAGDEEIATLHDCGHSISARLSPDEADRFSGALPEALHIETLNAHKARRRGR